MITANPNTYTFILPTNKGMLILQPENIIRVQSISNYCKVFFTDGSTVVVAKLLKWFEDKLAVQPFIRIHNTHLVNALCIKQYCKKNSTVSLSNNEWITVSRRRKTALLTYWN